MLSGFLENFCYIDRMQTKVVNFNSRQLVFKELFVGTLLYASVLGFLDDYTSIVFAKSYSYIFFAALVLEILTFYTLGLKKGVVNLFRGRTEIIYKFVMFFGVWLILFLSKFVFVWFVDTIFGDNVNIYGFFGILLLIATVTVLHKTTDIIFKKLA